MKKTLDQVIEEVITQKKPHDKFQIIDILGDVQLKIGKPPTAARGRRASHVINKLKKRNPPEIEELEKGKGCTSGVYRYVGPAHLPRTEHA